MFGPFCALLCNSMRFRISILPFSKLTSSPLTLNFTCKWRIEPKRLIFRPAVHRSLPSLLFRSFVFNSFYVCVEGRGVCIHLLGLWLWYQSCLVVHVLATTLIASRRSPQPRLKSSHDNCTLCSVSFCHFFPFSSFARLSALDVLVLKPLLSPHHLPDNKTSLLFVILVCAHLRSF